MGHIPRHIERHYTSRTGWIRAAVLGANDGIISTTSLLVGVASAQASDANIFMTGVAGLVAGALSMAAGEYVSVSSQADLEKSDIAREKKELVETPEAELLELTNIYIGHGLDPDLAKTVAVSLTAKDALTAHAREELGITTMTSARPLQAALSSAAAFAVGAAFPIFSSLVIPHAQFVLVCSVICILVLGALGAVGARLGGAPVLKPALRVMFWGLVAVGFSTVVGTLMGTAIP